MESSGSACRCGLIQAPWTMSGRCLWFCPSSEMASLLTRLPCCGSPTISQWAGWWLSGPLPQIPHHSSQWPQAASDWLSLGHCWQGMAGYNVTCFWVTWPSVMWGWSANISWNYGGGCWDGKGRVDPRWPQWEQRTILSCFFSSSRSGLLHTYRKEQKTAAWSVRS